MEKNNRKVVIVTGSSGGIGAGICEAFSQENWIVIGFDLKSAEHKFCEDEVVGDLTKSVDIEKLVHCVKDKYSRLDCVVNNAAYQSCLLLEDTPESEWEKVMAVNLKAPYVIAKQFLSLLEIYGGSIVNISSVHAVTTSRGVAAYGISKAAIAGMTRTMAVEFASCNVRVNGIMPGAIDTPMLRAHLSPVDVKKMEERHLVGRIGTPKEIGKWVTLLANNEISGFMTGQNIVIDGGATIMLSTES